MKERFYVPILKWKQGEQKALEALNSKEKDRITPLIELPPIEWDYENDCRKKDIDQHLERVPKTILTSWGKEKAFFFDMPYLDEEDEELSNGLHPYEHIFSEFKKEGLKGIPVIYCTADEYYLDIIRDIAQLKNLGLCVRIKSSDLTNLEDILETMLISLGINVNSVDLIIDLEYICPNSLETNLNSAKNCLRAIPEKSTWRSITLCSTSFPENLGGIEQDSIEKIKRGEWALWKSLFNKSNTSKYTFLPNFGDYGIQNPKLFSIDPRFMKAVANIRYTTQENFLIFRGRYAKKKKYEQCAQICNKIIHHKAYCGVDYSYGDNYIFDCANHKASTGNGTTWRRIGTNHHLTYVINQLSNLSYF